MLGKEEKLAVPTFKSVPVVICHKLKEKHPIFHQERGNVCISISLMARHTFVEAML